MRFSAWSSRVIWACSAALVLAPAASAHVSVSPAQAKPGQLLDLVFGVPNEDDAIGISRIMLTPPPGFDLDDAEAKSGWTQTRAGRSIVWSGGNIPRGQHATFAIRGAAPARVGTTVFDVRVADRTGRSSGYRVGLDVASAPRDYGKAALIVALAAAALALAGFFLGLYVWLRPQR